MTAVQVHETHERRGIERNSLLLGDGAQRVVNVRQMICGDVMDKSAVYFIVAYAAMEPAQKHDELHGDGDQNCQEVRQIG